MISIAHIGALASISGFSLRDIRKLSRRPRLFKGVSVELCKYLSLLSGQTDPLCGFWSLREWNYQAVSHSNRFVSGILAVLYKRKDNKWQCRLCLEYRKYRDRFFLLAGNGWLAHNFGLCSTEFYEVELWEEKEEGGLEGSCSEKSAYPRWIAPRNGVFSQIRIDSSGNLVGSFRNTGQAAPGFAEFVFHKHKRWEEYGFFLQEALV